MEITWRLIQTLGVMAIVFLGGTLVQGYYDQRNYNSLAAKYDTLQQTNAVLSTANGANQNQLSYLKSVINDSYDEMQSMLINFDRAVVYSTPGENVSIPIWTINQTLAANSTSAWGLLDTFDNHVSVKSNATLTYYVMDVYDVARYLQNSPSVYVTEYTGDSFQFDLRLSQGCSMYVLLMVNNSPHPALLEPNISATYAPAQTFTGACSLH